MTFSRVAQTAVAVTAWRLGVLDPNEDRVQLAVGTSYVQLDVENADSLGRYLLAAADTIRANRDNRLDVPTSAV